MKQVNYFFLSLLPLTFSLAARADTYGSYGTPPKDPNRAQDPYTVGVPLPADAFIEGSHQADARASPASYDVEFDTLFALQEPLNIASGAMGPLAFDRAALPEFELDAVSAPFFNRNFFSLSAKLGLGIAMNSRQSNVVTSGISTTDAQKLFLVPLKLGVQANFRNFSMAFKAHPFVEAALLPTYGVTTESMLADGQNLFGLFYQVGIGLEGRVSQLGGATLKLALVNEGGALQHSTPLQCLGLSAGVGLAL